MSALLALLLFAIAFAAFVWWVTRQDGETPTSEELPTETDPKAGTLHTLGDDFKDPLK